ncbi:hypothetical protein CLOM_g4664 [Closterium sp. NIES-68]|nr:hypothetical protein CLOM_g4664 [Closterium sp. NIES-68]GJP57694.1 hypothetical protein CLOP_g17110 [Closterium sp. NIES-67]
MAHSKTRFEALKLQPPSLPAGASPSLSPSAAASPCDGPVPAAAASAMKPAAEPVLIVDKWRAAIRCSSHGAADALGCSAERLADGASIYELADGMDAADWSNAVGSLSLGALWSAIEFWLRCSECSGPLSRHRVRLTLQRLRATACDRFLLATLSPAVGVCSSVEVFAGETEAAADGHLAPPHLRHLLAPAQLSAPLTPTGAYPAKKSPPSKEDSARSSRSSQATRENGAARTDASRGGIHGPPQPPLTRKSGEISCVTPAAAVASNSCVTAARIHSNNEGDCKGDQQASPSSKGNRFMRSISSLLASLSPKLTVRSPPASPETFANEPAASPLPGNRPTLTPGRSPIASKSPKSPRTAACGRHAPNPAHPPATSRGRSAAAVGAPAPVPAPLSYAQIPKSHTSPPTVFKDGEVKTGGVKSRGGLPKSPSGIGAGGSGGRQPKSPSGERASGERASGERASGERASGERASGERASGERRLRSSSGELASGGGGGLPKSPSGIGGASGSQSCNDRSPVSGSVGRYSRGMTPAAAAAATAIARVDAGGGSSGRNGGRNGGVGPRPGSSSSQSGRTARVGTPQSRGSTPPQLGASKSFGGACYIGEAGYMGGMVSPVAQATTTCRRGGNLVSARPSVANGGVVCIRVNDDGPVTRTGSKSKTVKRSASANSGNGSRNTPGALAVAAAVAAAAGGTGGSAGSGKAGGRLLRASASASHAETEIQVRRSAKAAGSAGEDHGVDSLRTSWRGSEHVVRKRRGLRPLHLEIPACAEENEIRVAETCRARLGGLEVVREMGEGDKGELGWGLRGGKISAKGDLGPLTPGRLMMLEKFGLAAGGLAERRAERKAGKTAEMKGESTARGEGERGWGKERNGETRRRVAPVGETRANERKGEPRRGRVREESDFGRCRYAGEEKGGRRIGGRETECEGKGREECGERWRENREGRCRGEWEGREGRQGLRDRERRECLDDESDEERCRRRRECSSSKGYSGRDECFSRGGEERRQREYGCAWERGAWNDLYSSSEREREGEREGQWRRQRGGKECGYEPWGKRDLIRHASDTGRGRASRLHRWDEEWDDEDDWRERDGDFDRDAYRSYSTGRGNLAYGKETAYSEPSDGESGRQEGKGRRGGEREGGCGKDRGWSSHRSESESESASVEETRERYTSRRRGRESEDRSDSSDDSADSEGSHESEEILRRGSRRVRIEDLEEAVESKECACHSFQGKGGTYDTCEDAREVEDLEGLEVESEEVESEGEGDRGWRNTKGGGESSTESREREAQPGRGNVDFVCRNRVALTNA